MPLKPTPRDRRGMGNDYTTGKLKTRRDDWSKHEANLVEDHYKRQDVADLHIQERQSKWSDAHATEEARVAMRDNWPTRLDFAKEGRRNSEQQAQVDGQRNQVMQGREDEQYEFQRQAQMETLAHPPRLQQQREEADTQAAINQASHPAHLQQRRDAAQQAHQREQDEQLRQAQELDLAAHPPRLQADREQREAAGKVAYPALAGYFAAEKFNWKHGWIWIGDGPGPGSHGHAEFLRNAQRANYDRSDTIARWKANAAADDIDAGHIHDAISHLREGAEHARTSGDKEAAEGLEWHAKKLEDAHLPDQHYIAELEHETGVGGGNPAVSSMSDDELEAELARRHAAQAS
jgi:hypothetical protein